MIGITFTKPVVGITALILLCAPSSLYPQEPCPGQAPGCGTRARDHGIPIPGGDDIEGVWDFTLIEFGGTNYLYGGTGAHNPLDFHSIAHLFYTPLPIHQNSIFTDAGHIQVDVPNGAMRAYSLTSRSTASDTLVIYGTSSNGWLASLDPKTLSQNSIGQVPWVVTGNTVIYDLVTLDSSPGDTVYGGSGDRASCVSGRARFFKWHPSSGIVDIPLPVEFRDTECNLNSLTIGWDGLIYGGTHPNAWFFAYDPGNGTFPLKIKVCDPSDGICEENVLSLVTEGNTRIWGGTTPNGKLFKYENNTLTVLGTAVLEPFQNAIWDLEINPPHFVHIPLYVYGGTAPDGFLFRYDPSADWCPGFGPGANPEKLGQAVCGENRIRSLQAVLGVRSVVGDTILVLAGGTGAVGPIPRGHVFSHDPVSAGPLSPRKPGDEFATISTDYKNQWEGSHLPDSTFLNLSTRREPVLDPRSLFLEASPNPLHRETEISFTLPNNGFVSLKIYDPSGRLVRNIVAEKKDSGEYSILWNGKNDAGGPVPTGIYLFRLTMDKAVATKKLLILR